MKFYNLPLITSFLILLIIACKNETITTENQRNQITGNTAEQFAETITETKTQKPEKTENLNSTNETQTKSPSIISKKIIKKIPQKETKKTTAFEFPQFGGGIGSGKPKSVYEMAFRSQKTQEFKVSHKEVKTIYGEQGTSITIYPNAFVYENSGKAVDKSITIKLQEYYKLSDILKAKLTTQTTKGELLETAGMIHIEAFANGQKLQLKDGKAIDIGFPYEQFKDGMELFEGVKNEDKSVLWEAMNIEPEESDEIFQVVERMPLFQGCDDPNKSFEEQRQCSDEQLMNFVYQQIRYPTIARENGIQGKVIIQFIIEKDGSISNVQIARNPGAGMGEEVTRVVGLLPNFVPGYQSGKPVRVAFNLPIRFRLEGAGFGSDTTYAFNNPLDSATLNQKFQNTATVNTATKGEIQRYVFSSTTLDWINCDRFKRMKGSEKTRLLASKSFKKEGDVMLIFHSIKSVINNYSNASGKVTFQAIPKGEKVTLFALDFKMGKFYVAKQEATITPNLNVDLDFEEVTLAKLDELMMEFDVLF
ncbi:MAG: energy transducer TonB [Saprospiraceae bacterium]